MQLVQLTIMVTWCEEERERERKGAGIGREGEGEHSLERGKKAKRAKKERMGRMRA